MIDRHALNPGDGKIVRPTAHFATIVVGAGPAGAAAALDAARGGGTVLLVDENPVATALMGSDVPLFYGGRATAAAATPARMIETLFATNPGLEAAFEAGVDVRLATMAWGLYANGPGLRTLPTPMLGLAAADHTYFVSFDAVILATGARDVVLGFPGWDQPGVMGAQAFHALLTRYQALASRRIVVVGSGALGLATALLAHANGIDVAAVVECGAAASGPVAMVAEVAAAGIELLTTTTVVRADGGIDGVERIIVTGSRGERTIAADTLVLAIAVDAATELLAAAGAMTVPVQIVGDAALDPPAASEIARWAHALAGPTDTIVCQCEGVTRGDLFGVQPPAYLDRPAALAARSLATLAGDGPLDPDQFKRLTRAGMGVCQGRRCRSQIAALLTEAGGAPVAPATWRAPVRPVPLGVLADWDERAAMAAGWDVWFGIPTQWTPYAAIGDEDEHLAGGGNMHV
jgi:thioredoxin reductase